MTNNNKSKNKVTHTAPSGMGGSFEVFIAQRLGNNRVIVEVVYPSRDWNGYRFECDETALKAI